jgi:hypothetical protein
MEVKLDALVAEIARDIDFELLECDPKFDTLPRSQRMHLILAMLADRDIARKEEASVGSTICWRPSRRLERYLGVKEHGIPDEHEDTEAPLAIVKLAQELSQALRAYNKEELKITLSATVQLFALCGLGMLEYVGKRNGQCEFRASPSFDAKAKEFEKYGVATGLIEVLGESDGVVVLRPVCD